MIKEFFAIGFISLGFASNNILNNNKSNLNFSSFESKIKKYILNGDNSYINKITTINFLDDTGYYIEFNDEDDNKLESLLIKGDFSNFKIETIYSADTELDINENYYCINPFQFVNEDELFYVIQTNDNEYSFEKLGVSFELNNKVSTSRYFKVNNISSKLKSYISDEVREVNLMNVPNYMNNRFGGSGCAPTAAAMYFSYLEDVGYGDLANNLNLPISHFDEKSKVNNFIDYIGNDYFKTTIKDGSFLKNIFYGYNNYFDNHGYGDYEMHVSKSYWELQNSIENCGLPVPTSMVIKKLVNNEIETYYHQVLAIGTREVQEPNYIDRYVNVNYASSSQLITCAITTDSIRQFYFGYK